jgi:hypothetical protein
MLFGFAGAKFSFCLGELNQVNVEVKLDELGIKISSVNIGLNKRVWEITIPHENSEAVFSALSIEQQKAFAMIFGVTKSIAELFEGELILGNEEVKIEDFVIHSNAGKDARQYLASGFGLEKTEILVVGENDLYQKLSVALEGEFVDISTVKSAEQARLTFERKRFSLVIAGDCNDPENLASLREQLETSKTAHVACSSDVLAKEACVAAGFKTVVSPVELERSIVSILLDNQPKDSPVQ